MCILAGKNLYFLNKEAPNKRKAYAEWPELAFMTGREEGSLGRRKIVKYGKSWLAVRAASKATRQRQMWKRDPGF
jgi:hypothetical protein